MSFSQLDFQPLDFPPSPEKQEYVDRAFVEADRTDKAVEHFVDGIVSNPLVNTLAEKLNFAHPETGTEADKLAALKDFSNKTWDFRSGKERQQSAGADFDEDLQAEIFAAADQWHMVESTHPSKRKYDFVTIPGGANMAPLLRVQYAKEQIEANGVHVPYMILLGSSRKLTEAEREKTAQYAPKAQDEYDLMNSAVETVYGVKSADQTTIDLNNFGVRAKDKDLWKVRYYEAAGGMKILTISAPQVEGEKRVNTADTYRFMNEVVGADMLNGASVLNVTTAHFVPFQQADALRLLGIKSNARVETIGYSADYAGGKRQAHELLQEMNSAINQTALLTEALAGHFEQRIKSEYRKQNSAILDVSYAEASGFLDAAEVYERDLEISRYSLNANALRERQEKYQPTPVQNPNSDNLSWRS